MEIEESSLYREILAIIRGGAKPVHYLWTAQIHIGNDTYIPLKVLSIDFRCDYELNYADEVMLMLALPGGMYAKRIYPNQSKLEITLFRSPIGEVSTSGDDEVQPQSERYTATLIDRGNPGVEGNGGNTPTEAILDLTTIHNIEFQLVNKSLEQLRMVSVGGIYRYTDVETVIRAVLTKESRKTQVEEVRKVKGVDMVPATNNVQRDHIVLPQGLQLVKVPEYIHQKCGGVYSAGMGYYLQGDFWYVYPCYDTTRFNQAERTLTVINVPKNKFPGIERTYRQDGKNLVVLATGEVRLADDSDAAQLNDGNGVRFADASKMMEGYVTVKDNKVAAARGANVSEFVSSQRPNGMQNVQLSSNPINANPHAEMSKLARREGSYLQMVWENSLPNLVYPGMMTKVLYLDEENIKEIYGVVLKVHHYVGLQGEGMTASRHVNNTMLAIFVKKQ
jgi:hypothetical protein